MTTDYLWDGSGAVDEEVRALEETLSSLRYQPSAQSLKLPGRMPWRAVAIGAVALAAAVAIWAGTRSTIEGISPERPGPGGTVAAAPAGSAKPSQSLVNPFKRAPTPRAPRGKAASAKVLDPWGDPSRKLDPSAVQRVVAAQKQTLHRRCFAPALAKRSPSAPDSVRLSTRLKVGADGQVASAVTTGSDQGYPGLARCVSRQARSWRFPASKSGGTVQVPFVFKSTDDSSLINPFKTPRTPPSGGSRVLDPWGSTPPASSSDLEDAMRKAQKPSASKPSVVDPWSRPSKASGSKLSPAQVRKVISQNRGSVMRGCWAVRKDGPNAPPTARVTLKLTIAPSGAVSRSVAADPPGYPGLGSCVANLARRWRFPAAGSSTSVTFPFVFARPN